MVDLDLVGADRVTIRQSKTYREGPYCPWASRLSSGGTLSSPPRRFRPSRPHSDPDKPVADDFVLLQPGAGPGAAQKVQAWQYDTLYEVEIANVLLSTGRRRSYASSVFLERENLEP